MIIKTSIKFVKKAGMWVKTTWIEERTKVVQKQEWFNEEPK